VQQQKRIAGPSAQTLELDAGDGNELRGRCGGDGGHSGFLAVRTRRSKPQFTVHWRYFGRIFNVTANLDLDAYCARVGYDGPRTATLSTLHAITAAHTRAIPFENLDVLLNRGIDIDPAAIFDKLVVRRRGGYCFEQNGLLLAVLEAFGFQVVPISARVRWQRPRDFTPPRTHVFLRVELDGESWLTDVGVGGMSLTAALRLEADLEQATPHEPRRLIREGARWFHQAWLGDAWYDVCEFTLEEMPVIDRVLGNWYTSAHPQSHFRSRLWVAVAGPDGERRTLLNRVLTMRLRTGGVETRTIGSPAELLEVLATQFGLALPPGTVLDCPGLDWTMPAS
jgi:N-hydroxyarylamine O-acetyltransferase